MIRGVGLRSAVAINVATMVGAGPFITLPLVVAALHGSVSAVAWVLGAVIALCDGLVWAELASRYPRSGGTYTYLREAFGPRGPGRFVAFLFVWQFLFWAPLILASGYIGFAQYAAFLIPGVTAAVPSHVLAAGVGIVTLLALYRPIPQIARTALVLGGVALVTLLAVAFAGLTHPYAPPAHTLAMTFSFGIGIVALGNALVITLYDYGGYGDVCALGDEVVMPSRTIPRAIVLSVLFVGAAYVLLNLGVAVAVPPKEIASSGTIASVVAQRAFGTPFAVAVTLAVMITAFGSTYGLLLGASRIPYAAALNGDFLAPFAKLHASGRFPVVSLVTIGLLALPASLLPLDAVISALTAGIVLVQGVGQIVALAVARAAQPNAPLRVPLYPLPPLIAAAGWVAIFWSTGWISIAFGLVTLAAGALLFLVRARIARSWPFGATAAVSLLVLVAFATPPAGAARGPSSLAAAPVPSPAPAPAVGAPATPARAVAAPSFGHAMIVRETRGEPELVVDGQPFFFWGGAFFYERIPAAQWRNSMLAMRELGANTLDLYVPWNWHELADGDYDFDGRTDPRRNLREVLRLGTELGFHFIVRPGPVIRNEWRNGGYPAWLLQRPEYDMPLHDVLEGRYPATATLQNARSDDAAAEWMRNAIHLRYAARWLHRALGELRPYADRVLAVQLDDDQGAYIDNQTYPAPSFQRYLRWLDAQVRDVVGPVTPTFINTYQMRVPRAAPVWTMGNWYQSDAYAVGMHDRIELDFSTLLLGTNRRGPLAQSEFQAGWLAGAEDPQPRPADPANTTLALDELLMLGARGVVDFPMQDTLAEPGWEAPFSNAAYTWDAALRYETLPDPTDTRAGLSDRMVPTLRFGALVRTFAPVVLAARRIAPVAIAYGEPPPRADSRPPDGASGVVTRVRAALAACIERGVSCDLLDVRQDAARASRYEVVVVVPDVAAAAPGAVAALRARLRGTRTVIAATVPNRTGPATATLRGPRGALTIAGNWSDAPLRVRFGRAAATVAPHDVAVRVDDVALSALGARGDRRRVSSDDCDASGGSARWDEPADAVLRSQAGCTVRIADGPRIVTLRLEPYERLHLPSMRREQRPYNDGVTGRRARDETGLAPSLDVAVDDGGDPPADAAVARMRPALDGIARDEIVLRNDRLRVIVDPHAGARALSMQACPTARVPCQSSARRPGWSPNAFDATGAWRDDVSEPLAPSPRDYIAKYTHAYPAGTFNREYRVEILEAQPRAVVRLTYAMPDANPPGALFERVLTLEPHAARVVVDERLVVPAASPQRLVVRSSLPALAMRPLGTGREDVPLDDVPRDRAGDVSAAAGGLATFARGRAFAVTWNAAGVERAAWTPYRSTGTLALTFAPGWHRTTYAYAGAASAEEARWFVQAERAWLAANPAPGRR
jgi:amino acid transporter